MPLSKLRIAAKLCSHFPKIGFSRACSQLSISKKSRENWSTSVKTHDWNRAISDAERIVGHPTTLFSLKCLLSEEFTSVAQYLRKLLATNHPILKTAKRLVYDGRTNMQTRGLVVLLLSKAAGHTSSCSDISAVSEHGITPRQQNLSEITEMIHTAHLIHKGILNLSQASHIQDVDMQDLQFGNKISILSGDFLLANACKGLANLRNCKVVDLISKAISDFMQSEFIGEYDEDGNQVPFHDMNLSFWEQKYYLSAGSLIANSCKAALELAGHDEALQERGFDFGKNVGLAWQVYADLQPFVDSLGHPPGTPINFSSLPVVFHLENNTKLIDNLKEQIQAKNKEFDFKLLYHMILEGDGVERAKDSLLQYSNNAEVILKDFGTSAASKALSNILNSLKS